MGTCPIFPNAREGGVAFQAIYGMDVKLYGRALSNYPVYWTLENPDQGKILENFMDHENMPIKCKIKVQSAGGNQNLPDLFNDFNWIITNLINLINKIKEW